MSMLQWTQVLEMKVCEPFLFVRSASLFGGTPVGFDLCSRGGHPHFHCGISLTHIAAQGNLEEDMKKGWYQCR